MNNFRIIVANQTEYIITIDVSQVSAKDTKNKSAFRWKMEPFQREEHKLHVLKNANAEPTEVNEIISSVVLWIGSFYLMLPIKMVKQFTKGKRVL